MPIDPSNLWQPKIDFHNELTFPSALLGLPRTATSPHANPQETYLKDRERDREGLLYALEQVFEGTNYPSHRAHDEVFWRRDPLGRPYVTWEGEVLEWANKNGMEEQHLHLSNSHDGAAHLLLVTYCPTLVGIGIDVVSLPRFQNKSRPELHRFARKIMSDTEFNGLQASLQEESEPELRNRIVAHFSLMEAASKACGTGLKMGLGMGRATSLPMHSLGAKRVLPRVELLFEDLALDRLSALGATRQTGYVTWEEDYLTSVVLLWRD